jgi:hypothetical protein
METKELILSKYAELQEEQLKARQDFKERTNALLESAMEHSPIKVDERITHSGVDYIITTIEPSPLLYTKGKLRSLITRS